MIIACSVYAYVAILLLLQGKLVVWLSKWVVSPVFGPACPCSQWVDFDAPKSNIVARMGVLFESNSGSLHALRGATYELSPKTGRLQRYGRGFLATDCGLCGCLLVHTLLMSSMGLGLALRHVQRQTMFCQSKICFISSPVSDAASCPDCKG